MTRRSFARSGALYHLRTNLAVLAGVAAAVAVLTGALITGDSVRSSLRRLVLDRLGKTAQVLTGPVFFRDELSRDMRGTPLIALEGLASKQGGERAGGVFIYGIDERFWGFHSKAAPQFANGETMLSPGLARELNAQPGDTVLLRLEKPSAIPRESLHGRKEDTGRSVRLRVAGVLPREAMGEFALRPSQGEVKAAFVHLRRLQRDLDQEGEVNTLLFGNDAKPDLQKVTLADMGIQVAEQGELAQITTDSAVISDSLEAAVGADVKQRFLTYLVNTIATADGRAVPYSLATGVSRDFLDVPAGSVVINDWTAKQLGAQAGSKVRLEYYVWDPSGALLTRTAEFAVSRVIPTKDDRTLAPTYPGITEATTLGDWDPPFPMDLKKVRPVDEEYWKQYRTTPKLFLAIEDARKLWGSRFGHSTSLRVSQSAVAGLRARIAPSQVGMLLVDVRDAGVSASKGSTDFGEYFLYFSFFLVVSALMLASVFFQLNVDQRLREVGLLRALGFSSVTIQRHFLREGLPLAAWGSLLGVVLGVGYAAFILYGLRTWWRGAVGTSELTLHIHSSAITGGFFMGLFTSVATIALCVRGLRKLSPRSLLAGVRETESSLRVPARWPIAVFAVLGVSLTIAGFLHVIPAAGAFFGAGLFTLIAGVLWVRLRLRTSAGSAIQSLSTLGFRNASWKPSRSSVCVTLIAVAVFLLVSLEAFRQQHTSAPSRYSMVAESQLPIVYDLNVAANREAIGLRTNEVRFFPFRLKPGDDASCLNLYEPRNPRVIGAGAAFLAEEPWKLLQQTLPDGVAPAIADANSMQYVLHKKVGDILTLPDGAKLQFVGSVSGSVLQGEIVIAERDFIRLFPQEQGYRFFLMQGPESNVAPLEEQLSDFGFDATTVEQKLAAYHQVENTYLSTFQALGALGLLLGIVGLSAVLMRNVFERRKEMALLRAVGMQGGDLSRLVLAENAVLVAIGVALGLASALLAVLPAVLERGVAGLPVFAILILIGAVGAASLLASTAAIRFVRRLPLLQALRSDS
ncbi:ABC transporter permease [Bryobacterales bacterium F-183]|nr:ABC transporter permease [Bryobacterales bacterium F-183]